MLTNLNDEQKKAVETTNGPLLIIAGAGSGKTKVLTTRIAYLINNKKVSPNQILAITFTNKAALEMKSRVVQLIGEKAFDMQISTFHSFGLKIIKENYQQLSLPKKFSILDNQDSLTLVKRVVKELNLDPKQYNPKYFQNRISSCKNNLITEKEFKKFIASPIDEIFHQIFEKYQIKLKTGSGVDFDDLLLKPISLLEKNQDILAKYQEQYKYILIDEYQDTNEAQYQLVKILSQKYQNICVVGDESQSIYGFRGANYKNILNFEKDFPNCQQVILEKNYRSTKNILKVANNVIKHNLQRKEKNLWTDNAAGENIVVNLLLNEYSEAEYIIEKIQKLRADGINLEDIAILYRTNAQSRVIEEAILKAGLPYRIVGNVYFYNRKEIKDMIAYLKLIHNENDDASLLRVINEPRRGIGQKSIANIEQVANEKNSSLFVAINEGAPLKFKELIVKLKEEAKNANLVELIEIVLDKTDMREQLKKEGTTEAEIRLENLEEFKSIAANFQENYGIISLEDFLDQISLVSDVTEYSEETSQLTLMTIHSAKGLEFKYVFLIGLEENLLPHYNSINNNEIEEERRLCYVAITRAKEQLWLLYTQKRTIFGKLSFPMPSRFIKEMDLQIQKQTNNILEKKVDETIEYEIGEKVFNNKYGKGTIVEINNNILTIAFANKMQKFIKGHKSIKKI